DPGPGSGQDGERQERAPGEQRHPEAQAAGARPSPHPQDEEHRKQDVQRQDREDHGSAADSITPATLSGWPESIRVESAPTKDFNGIFCNFLLDLRRNRGTFTPEAPAPFTPAA